MIVAKANASIQPKPVQLAPVKAYRDVWVTPHEKDPFAVSMQEKIDLLQRVLRRGSQEKSARVRAALPTSISAREDKYFASSEGSSIQQLIIQIYGIVHRHGGRSRRRAFRASRNYYADAGIRRLGIRAGNESRRKCDAHPRRGDRASERARRSSPARRI